MELRRGLVMPKEVVETRDEERERNGRGRWDKMGRQRTQYF